MLQLELPHVNVLSKMDLITQYGQLRVFSPLPPLSFHVWSILNG